VRKRRCFWAGFDVSLATTESLKQKVWEAWKLFRAKVTGTGFERLRESTGSQARIRSVARLKRFQPNDRLDASRT
jgi:hypothetical protein